VKNIDPVYDITCSKFTNILLVIAGLRSRLHDTMQAGNLFFDDTSIKALIVVFQFSLHWTLGV
jgi:hypothetical protein